MKTTRTVRNATLAFAMFAAASCSTHYELSSVNRSRILIDSRYDKADAELETLMSPYRQKVDSVMSPVVGLAARPLESYQPESPLSNLLADILVWAGKDFGETPDFAVYNVGGIRASFAKGEVTYGDVLDVAPFENRLCFLTLTGDKVEELFGQMAGYGGQGVSHGVEVVMDKNRKLVSVKLHGQAIDKSKKYRIATLDYLAEGNDKLLAFKSQTDTRFLTGAENNVRAFIVKYFKTQYEQGKAVDSQTEGRFVKIK